MTTRARAAAIAVIFTLLAGTIAFVAFGRGHHHRPASAAAPLVATSPPATVTASTAPPAITAPTAAVTGPAVTVPETAPPPAADPWQAVSQVPGLDQLVTPLGVVVRIDPRTLDVALVAGTAEPGGTFPEGGQVPPASRASLALATNAGFKRADARGGELVDGRTVGSLVAGIASLVIHTDGTMNVGAWGGSVGPGPDNAAVLQNLTMLVDGGQPAADLSGNIIQRWGATFRPALPVAVWRSGAGIDSQGRLLWAAGPNLVPAQLAQLLIGAGAVRAMQLDINHMWVFASVFIHPDPHRPDLLEGHSLLAGMTPTPDHVLTPGARDFLAVYQRPAIPHRLGGVA